MLCLARIQQVLGALLEAGRAPGVRAAAWSLFELLLPRCIAVEVGVSLSCCVIVYVY
jgi:hypothetical protein